MSEWTIWESNDGEIKLEAAFHPGVSREEGFHLVLLQKTGLPSPWSDPEFFGRMMAIAARATDATIKLDMADWGNIQYNGNIGAAGKEPVLHIHIFGRLKTGPLWGGPLQLPAGEGPYGYDPLTAEEIARLRSAIAEQGGLE